MLAAAAALGGCAVRDQPYRFASPMIGVAQLPPPRGPAGPRRVTPARPHAATRTAQAIRAVQAPKIREASAAAAAQVALAPAAREDALTALPAPHLVTADAALPAIRTPLDLRALVGRRDARDPVVAATGWARALGSPSEAATGPELVAWADATGRLAAPTTPAVPGDLLVFDHVVSDQEADLVAIVVARDARGVTELVYVGGGVIRRGFIDASRPSVKRDAGRAVVNTFLRHGRRWPAPGAHYLAGELLAHVVRAR